MEKSGLAVRVQIMKQVVCERLSSPLLEVIKHSQNDHLVGGVGEGAGWPRWPLGAVHPQEGSRFLRDLGREGLLPGLGVSEGLFLKFSG